MEAAPVLLGLAAKWALDYRRVYREGGGSSQSSMSGWDVRGSQWHPYARRLEDGSPVVDKRHLLEKSESFTGDVMRCPLVDVDRTEDEPGSGGFRYVTVETWLAYWRFHGARIGYRYGEVVLWEDGTAEDLDEVTS